MLHRSSMRRFDQARAPHVPVLLAGRGRKERLRWCVRAGQARVVYVHRGRRPFPGVYRRASPANGRSSDETLAGGAQRVSYRRSWVFYLVKSREKSVTGTRPAHTRGRPAPSAELLRTGVMVKKCAALWLSQDIIHKHVLGNAISFNFLWIYFPLRSPV